MHEHRHLRVVIACVTFEVAKIIEPIKHYRADKVYLLYLGRKDVYVDFLNEVTSQLDSLKISYEKNQIDILKFAPVMKHLVRIIRNEQREGNHVYINISAGTHIFSAAALIASMQEGATPFDVHTKQYMIDEREYYDKPSNKPVGLSREVEPPEPIPQFKIHAPKRDLVLGLHCWSEIERVKGKVNQTLVIVLMGEKGILNDIHCNDSRGRTKVSQGAKMRLKRGFIDAWIREGWMEKKERGIYWITPWGREMLDIYSDNYLHDPQE